MNRPDDIGLEISHISDEQRREDIGPAMTLPMTPGGQLHLALSVCSGTPQNGNALYARLCVWALRGAQRPAHLRRFEEQLGLLALFGLLSRAHSGWQLTAAGEARLDQLGPWCARLPLATVPVPGGSYA